MTSLTKRLSFASRFEFQKNVLFLSCDTSELIVMILDLFLFLPSTYHSIWVIKVLISHRIIPIKSALLSCLLSDKFWPVLLRLRNICYLCIQLLLPVALYIFPFRIIGSTMKKPNRNSSQNINMSLINFFKISIRKVSFKTNFKLSQLLPSSWLPASVWFCMTTHPPSKQGVSEYLLRKI